MGKKRAEEAGPATALAEAVKKLASGLKQYMTSNDARVKEAEDRIERLEKRDRDTSTGTSSGNDNKQS
jgi:hypothetical protein